LFGLYEDFPKNIHGITRFQHNNLSKDLQHAILKTLYRLNNEIFDFGVLTQYIKQNCEISFEFGVADGFSFSFLDQNELDHCLKRVDETELGTLDFFFAVRYHIFKDDDKRVPLRFDYHVLRFFFQKDILELRIRHEKGIRRVSLDDLSRFLVDQINDELSRRQLEPLFFGNFNKVNLQ